MVYQEHNLKEGGSVCDILLVMPPPWGIEGPPLSIACLSSQLNKEGISVEVFDFNIGLYNIVPEEFRYLWSMNYSDYWQDKDKYQRIKNELKYYIRILSGKIIDFPGKIIGFSLSCNCPDLIVRETIKAIKDRDSDKIIILGGTSISIDQQRDCLLEGIGRWVDFCVIGEGEQVLPQLIKMIKSGTRDNSGSLSGVLSRDSFGIRKDKSSLKSWQGIAFPEFDKFDLARYGDRGKSLPIEFSRGCIGNCPFCDFRSISPVFKVKDPDLILKQIRFYLDRYKINHLSVIDASVNSNIYVLEQVCEGLIRQDLNVRFSALAIPRREMNYELLVKMKRAGFQRLEYGIESGSDNVLRSMRKIFNSKTAAKVLEDSYRAGIAVYVYLIAGYLNETDSDFQATKDFLSRNAQYITMIKSINPLYLMAGSEIFNNPGKYKVNIPPVRGDREWFTDSGNDYRLRRERVMDLKRHAKEIGVAFTEEAESHEFSSE
jgi:anaerobic magnesium-protoporphyrin IX monomethyl ester cyclase